MGPPVVLKRDSVAEPGALSDNVGALVEVKILVLEPPPEASGRQPWMFQGATRLAVDGRGMSRSGVQGLVEATTAT